MTNQKDCPEITNDIRAEFVDTAAADQSAASILIDSRARLIADWKADALPKALAGNAARLHTHNSRELRKAGAAVDEHRQTPEGREAYNAKQRANYAKRKSEEPREYVTGLSAEEKAERRRQKDRERKAARRRLMTQGERDAEAAKKRDQRELAAIARKAERKIF